MARRIALVLFAFAFGGASFVLFGSFRTLTAEVGFDAATVALSSAAVLLFLSPALLLVGAVGAFVTRRNHGARMGTARAAALALCTILLGCAFSEAWIEVDEGRFARDVEARALTAHFARPRAWPNETASLVFAPGRGVTATD